MFHDTYNTFWQFPGQNVLYSDWNIFHYYPTSGMFDANLEAGNFAIWLPR